MNHTTLYNLDLTRNKNRYLSTTGLAIATTKKAHSLHSLRITKISDDKNHNKRKPRIPKILLVEDEPIAQIIGSENLKDLGCEVTVVGDARSALACFHLHDLVLLDIGLPDIDGRDVCKMMRNKSTKLPIIAHTVFIKNIFMQNGCNFAWFTYYLEKPVGINAMHKTLNKYLPTSLAKKLKNPFNAAE